MGDIELTSDVSAGDRELHSPLASILRRRTIPPPDVETPVSREVKKPKPGFFDYFTERPGATETKHCLFICWDFPNSFQWAVDIPVKSPLDGISVFRDMRQRYGEQRGFWWKCFSQFGLELTAEPVEFCFTGHTRRGGHPFAVVMEPLNLKAMRETLQKSWEDIQLVVQHETFDPPGVCIQENETGRYNHGYNPNCPIHIGLPEGRYCSHELRDVAKRHRGTFNFASPLLTRYVRDPTVADGDGPRVLKEFGPINFLYSWT